MDHWMMSGRGMWIIRVAPWRKWGSHDPGRNSGPRVGPGYWGRTVFLLRPLEQGGPEPVGDGRVS